MGKNASIILDLKTPDGKASLESLLKDADVFITNVRTDGLRKLGLHYDDIKEKFPHLIFAQCTAYGREGPDYQLPGYDIGAFWASTGLAAMIQTGGSYSTYALAYGDTTTGASLLGGVIAALVQRLRTGQGAMVEASLNRVGMYCVSPYMIRGGYLIQP